MKRDAALAPLDHMIALAGQFATRDERVATAIPFLSLLRSAHPTPVSRGVLKPSCCLILQGEKRVIVGSTTLDYGPGEYLVVTLDMAGAGHIVNATPEQPYLLLNLELDPAELASIVLEAGIKLTAALTAPAEPVMAAYVGRAGGELLEAWYKLLRLLQSPPQEAAFLAVGLRREIIYRLLTGPHGYQLYQNIVLDQQDLGISKAIAWLKANFTRTIKVEELAQATHMSVSSLHHRFKAVTAMGPLQYQKQLRLQQARALMLAGSADAGTAAYQVGYDSASQFSREYRRLFGAPPMQDIKALRGGLAP
jgi:AraC-like DNA-binding protein